MSVRHVDAREAYRLQQEERYTYVDVRSIPEYSQGHPAGAVNVPLLHYDPRTREMVPNPDFLDVLERNFPRDAKLLVGCQSGRRSAQAAQLLAASGYQDVLNVKGSFGGTLDPETGEVIEAGWLQLNLPVEMTTGAGSYEEMRGRPQSG